MEHKFANAKVGRPSYTRGCRCDGCKQANRDYSREKRKGLTQYDRATRYDYMEVALQAIVAKPRDPNALESLLSRARVVIEGKIDGSNRPKKKGSSW